MLEESLDTKIPANVGSFLDQHGSTRINFFGTARLSDKQAFPDDPGAVGHEQTQAKGGSG